MHWSVKLYIIFMIIGVLFQLFELFFDQPQLQRTCVENCAKQDIQCQRDCEIEGNDSFDVSM